MRYYNTFLRTLLLFAACLTGSLVATSQIGINTTGSSPDSSSILDISASDKGLLIPRMTTAERLAIPSPADGLIVYDSTTETIWYYHTPEWHEIPIRPLTVMADTDGDTKIQVEEGADEDLIRFDLGGSEKYVFYPARIHLNGASNTSIGNDAGSALTSGYGNIAVGISALKNATTGISNVALGAYALQNNISGSGNTAVGNDALQLANSNGNTAVGNNAMQYTTTGNNSSAFGSGALRSSATGVNNTALGNSALANLTAGNWNSAVGTGSLYALESGNGNTTMGHNSNSNLQTGSYNVVLGMKALEQASAYNSGVAIGHGAGILVTSGERSVLIGAGAGGNVDTTSTGNVFIGYRAGYDEPGSNLLYIENSSSPTPLIWGDFANDSVRINGTLSIQDAYTFPNTDGGAGFALTSDGNGTTGWTDLSGYAITDSINMLRDADGDTKIQVEESPDEDLIRFDISGAEHYVFYPQRIHFTDTVNTVIGSDAGVSMTFGHANTSIGNNAMRNNTTGSYNVAVGEGTMESSTNNSNSTAVGFNALQNANASSNTAVGSDALKSTTSGSANSALGANALDSNTSGVSNTAIGNLALSSTTNSSSNTAVGNAALYALIGGNENTAIGLDANKMLQTGAYNATMGVKAMEKATAYTSGVAIGHLAGFKITSGENNVLLGAGAGGNIDTISSGNVFIGFQAGYNEHGSDLLFIENSSSPSPLIWGDFANDSVRINGTLAIGNAYALPNMDGNAGYALTTDGNGVTNWSDISTLIVPDTLSIIRDADNDTRITVEATADEDLIRMVLNDQTSYTFYPSRIHITGNNSSIGENAGLSMTTGYNNTAIGALSLRNTTTGSSNVAVGVSCLQNTISGAGNTAIGYKALQNANASGNTAVGSNAMQSTTTGNNSSAFGSGALNASTTGVNNTALGNAALGKLTSGNWNSASGTGSLYNLEAGNGNSAMGHNANSALTTGNYNATVGMKAMEKATNYSYGVAVGQGAGGKITSGANSVFIGAGAGGNVDTTSTGNVFIGYQAGYNEPGSGLLYIENSSSPTPLIYGDFSNDSLAVNGSLTVNANFNTNSHWISGDGDDEGISIASNGRVGIGMNTPANGALEVSGTGDVVNLNNWAYYSFDGYAISQPPTQSVYSIYTDGVIGATLFHAHSDERIKHILGVSDSHEDLATLMQIEITDYTMIDTVLRGDGLQKKVIAQQVLDVYPQAVDTNTTEVVPDIYRMAAVDNEWVHLSTDLKHGDVIRCITEAGQEFYTVNRVEADRFNLEQQTELLAQCSQGQVFVYGRQVHNFHTVDYEAIAMLNVSATQELAHRNFELSQEVSALKESLRSVQSAMAEIRAWYESNRSNTVEFSQGK